MTDSKLNRRNFLKTTAVGAAGLSILANTASAETAIEPTLGLGRKREIRQRSGDQNQSGNQHGSRAEAHDQRLGVSDGERSHRDRGRQEGEPCFQSVVIENTLQQGTINAGFIFFVLAILATLIFGRFVCGWV